MEWVSMDDRLPELAGMYLCYFEGTQVMQVLYGEPNKGWFLPYKITHWRPLPDRPKIDMELI